MSKRKAGPGLNRSTAFDWINYTVMVLLAFIMIYPLWYCVAGSLNEGMDYLRGGVFLWPRKWTLANYKAVFLDSAILNAFWVTIWKCLVGTVTSVLCTAMVAYAITRPKLRLKKLYIPFIMLTMFFSGGLIPYFILIVDLGLYDSFWVYIIPTMFSAYNMIIIQSFMRELPSELIESAKLDGASEIPDILPDDPAPVQASAGYHRPVYGGHTLEFLFRLHDVHLVPGAADHSAVSEEGHHRPVRIQRAGLRSHHRDPGSGGDADAAGGQAGNYGGHRSAGGLHLSVFAAVLCQGRNRGSGQGLIPAAP